LLQLRSRDGQPVTAISAAGWESLNPQQRHVLSCGGRLVVPVIPTIEACGGGSVRCMIAEIFLPRQPSPSSDAGI
jgi:hypothetical protein